MEEEKQPKELKKQRDVGWIDGISCQHLLVLMAHSLQKQWEWQAHRQDGPTHRSLRFPTMYVSSMDIRTAFVVAKPQHIAKDLEELHGGPIAALLGEIDDLDGEANLENMESTFPFTKCIRQGSVEAPRLYKCCGM